MLPVMISGAYTGFGVSRLEGVLVVGRGFRGCLYLYSDNFRRGPATGPLKSAIYAGYTTINSLLVYTKV